MLSLCVRMLSHFSHVQLCATLWTVACQAPLSMEFFRQEYWSRMPFPSPEGLPNPGIEPIAGRLFTTEATKESLLGYKMRMQLHFVLVSCVIQL